MTPVYKTADAARAAAMSNSTAFSTMGTMVSQVPSNMYQSTNPWISYASATDLAQKALLLQDIRRSMSTAGSGPGGNGTQYEYLQALLRATGFSKDKTPIGFVGPTEQAALEKVIALSIANNMEPVSYLELLKKYGVGGGATVKQPDTTTQYSKQVSTALKLKDKGDAQIAYTNAYYAAFGQNPPKAGIEAFGSAWNAEEKAQLPTTTADYMVEKQALWDKKSKPVIDPKTKKQKVDKWGDPIYSKPLYDKSGILQYKDRTTSKTTTVGLGFTEEEQQQFLATYLTKNFPDIKDVENLGGAAKTIYDDLVATSSKNFLNAPDFATLAPTIKEILGSADAATQSELIKKYKEGLRKQTAIKYMGLADYLNAGDDADKYVTPLRQAFSNALETDVTMTDDLMKQALNFKGEDGKYRLPNDWEMNQLVMNDKRRAYTSQARNESVNMFQSLMSKLG
jgi:hypothetical protein